MDGPTSERTGKDAPPRLGRYVELSLLGKGGMGAVYRGRDPALDRAVAIKVMSDNSPEFVARFHREARAIARLSHANIVQVYDFGEDEAGSPYFVMELSSGKSLEAVLKERGRLPSLEVAQLVRQAACGLGAAHAAGIVHRDIKPANLILDDAGVLKLVDFGIARMAAPLEEGQAALTGPMDLLGTPLYMSPEILSGQVVDGRADIYALGLTAFHLLAGRPPFTAPRTMGIVTKQLSEPLPDLTLAAPQTPDVLRRLIERMTCKDREARVQRCEGVVREIDAMLPALSAAGSARAAGLGGLGGLGPGTAARRLALGLSGGLLVALVGTGLVFRGGLSPAPTGPKEGPKDWPKDKIEVHPPRDPPRTDDPREQTRKDPVQAGGTEGQAGQAQGDRQPGKLVPGKDGLRVAVLKFKNLGGERDLDFLTEGIGETVLTSLGHAGPAARIRLVERNQVDQAIQEIDFGQTKYVDKKTAAVLGRIAGAEVAVQGGYQRSGGRIRVTARFVRIETGEILDTLVLTREATALFDVQDAVAAELKKRLLGLLGK